MMEEEKKPEKPDYLRVLEESMAKNEKIVEEMRSLVARNEELAARNLLGGKSDAGVQSAVPVETPKQYKDRVMSGKL